MSKTRSKKQKKIVVAPAGEGDAVEVLEGEVMPAESVSDDETSSSGETNGLADVIEISDEGPESGDAERVDLDAADRKSLVPYNAFDAYLAEIRMLKPLTREREHEVAVDFH